MALTTVTVGRVDVPASQLGQPGQPSDLAQWDIDVTLVAGGADYTAGINTTATILTALGLSGITSVTGVVRDNANAIKGNQLVLWDANTAKIRSFVTTTGAEYAGVAGDTFRLRITGS